MKPCLRIGFKWKVRYKVTNHHEMTYMSLVVDEIRFYCCWNAHISIGSFSITQSMCVLIKCFPHTLAASSLLLPVFTGNVQWNCCVYQAFLCKLPQRPKLLCYVKINGCWASVGILTSFWTQPKFSMYELWPYPPRVCFFSFLTHFSQSKTEEIYKPHIVTLSL